MKRREDEKWKKKERKIKTVKRRKVPRWNGEDTIVYTLRYYKAQIFFISTPNTGLYLITSTSFATSPTVLSKDVLLAFPLNVKMFLTFSSVPADLQHKDCAIFHTPVRY